MGVVWAAVDELLGRPVAVKEVIPPQGLTAEQAELTRSRTLREARAAARITSRGAVNVYDVVQEDGRPWIVMERLDARSLSELVNAEGPLPPARVTEIAGQLLAALTAAHASGVLHRDVKPSNVMIERDGRVVLTDFGIASLHGDPAITTTGILIGSPAYIAPERAHGEPATAASDLWSLGCTMFAALEGRPPFDRNSSMATLTAVITEDPLPAPSAGPLAPVLDGLLRKDPRQRLSAEDTDRMLREIARGPAQLATAPPRTTTPITRPPLSGGRTTVLPVVPADAGRPPVARPATRLPPGARPPGPVGPPPRPGRQRAVLLWLGVAAALLAVAVAGVLIWIRDDQPTEAAAAGSSAQPTGTGSADPTTGPADPTTVEPTTTEPTPTDPATTSVEPTSVGAAVPDGFRLYQDDTGFALAVPADWTVTKDGPRTDFIEPGTGRFLRIDQTRDPQPDPVADWENQEVSTSARLDGYERIRIEPVDYRDYDAADWAFTWDPHDGPPLHVLNRNLITGPDRAYALYWSTPEDQWQDSLPLFQTFTDTFQPAP